MPPVGELLSLAASGGDDLELPPGPGVAWVPLNGPEVLNGFDAVMMHELHECWRGLRDNDEDNAIVLTGALDKAFCAGVDREAAGVGKPDRATDLGGTPLHWPTWIQRTETSPFPAR